MKTLVIAAAAAMLAVASPAWSQTSQQSQPQSNDQAPGMGGVSKPGLAGKPGSKSGPTVTPSSGTSVPSGTNAGRSGDESKVPGKPGGKSGPASNATGTGSETNSK